MVCLARLLLKLIHPNPLNAGKTSLFLLYLPCHFALSDGTKNFKELTMKKGLLMVIGAIAAMWLVGCAPGGASASTHTTQPLTATAATLGNSGHIS